MRRIVITLLLLALSAVVVTPVLACPDPVPLVTSARQ